MYKQSSILMNMTFENVVDDSGKNTTKGDRPVHFFGVCLIQKLLPEDLLQEIKQKQAMSVEESRNKIKSLFNPADLSNEVAEQKIRVTSRCPITSTTIEYPGKGNNCLHVQPLCLKNMLKSFYSNHPRQWTCPICKMPCHRLVYDSYLEKVIQEMSQKDSDICYFVEDGSYTIEEGSPSKVIDESMHHGEIASIASDDEDFNKRDDSIETGFNLTGAQASPIILTCDLSQQDESEATETAKFFIDFTRKPQAREMLTTLNSKLIDFLGLTELDLVNVQPLN